MVFVFKFTETLLVCLLVESLFKVWGFFLSVFYFLLFKKISASSVYTLETRKNSEKYCRSKLSYYSPPPHSFYGTVLFTQGRHSANVNVML